MKQAWMIVILLLLISVGGNVYQWQNARTEQLRRSLDNGRSQVEILKHEAAAKTAGARADSLVSVFGKRRAADSVALRAVRMRNSAMAETLKKLRIPVQPLIDSLPDLRAFVLANDSLLAAKDEHIHQLELRHSAQVVDLEAIIFELQKQNLAQAAISDAWRETATSMRQDLRVEKRKRKLWTTISVVLTGGILYMAVKE
jgi:hypothetical protein